MCIQEKERRNKKVKLYKKQVKLNCYTQHIKKVKGVIFMLPLVIELSNIIVGRVVAKEVKKLWKED